MNPPKKIIPKALFKFICTGASCRDNCCRTGLWGILIDDYSMERYGQLEEDKKNYVMDRIVEKDGKPYMKNMEDGRCAFLMDDGLCWKVINLGEDYLCDTCTIYPRRRQPFNGNLEFSLHLSCPDAIPFILYNREGITFEEQPYDGTVEPPEPLEQSAYNIRALLFGIVIYKGFTLMDKLFYMGLLMKALDELPKGEGFDDAATEVLQHYHESLYIPEVIDEIKNARKETNLDIATETMAVLATLAVGIVQTENSSKESIKNKKLYKRLESFREAANSRETALRTRENYEKLIIPYIHENIYVFENYLFYQLYATQFPKTTTEYEKGYKEFIGEFLTMLIFTCGLFRTQKKLQHRDMEDGIYLFHRYMGHNINLRQKLVDIFDVLDMEKYLSLFGSLK